MATEKVYLWTAFILGVVAVMLLWLSVPQQQLRVHGIILPSGVASSVHVAPADVHLVAGFSVPAEAKRLGEINIELHYSADHEQQQLKQLFAKAKQLAASVGANKVFVRYGHAEPGSISMIWQLNGVAVDSDQTADILEPGPVMPPY